MNHYLGIDIGTSGCKAVVFDDAGHPVASAHRGYDILSQAPGWAELDTDEVMECCFQVIRESALRAGEGTVTGIGISSQGEAFTLLDQNGRALCNALVSSDIRANEMIAPWAELLADEELYQITGHTPHPMFSLFKLLWIREHEPHIWAQARRVVCFEDLLQYRLGITDPAMGWPLAGRTMLFDVVGHEWSDKILDLAGISRQQLSRPLPSGTIAGAVDNAIARDLHLAGGAVVVTGGHDQPCSALGAGAIGPGIAVNSAGTVECITPAFSRPVFTAELRRNNLCTYDHAAPGMYATVAFTLTGGNLLKWFRDEFGSSEVEEALLTGRDPYELLLEQMPIEPSRLLVLPYFTPTGTPYFDVQVKGAILGLDLSVTRGEILKALLEGVAFEIRLNLEILRQSGYEVKELRVIGGGARSIRQIGLKADVLGMPVIALDVSEAGCLGVAMLVCSALTGREVREIAGVWVQPAASVEPKHQAHYRDKFELYRKLYPAIKLLG